MLGQIISDAPLAAGSDGAPNSAALLTLYSATEDFETGFGEVPENTIFPGTLMSPLRVERSLLSGLLGGTVAVSYGEAELVGLDRTYDDIEKDFDVAGRPIEIKVGAPDWCFADFITLFDGTASGWRADEDKLIVQLRGWEYLLEVAFESRTFAGTGGLAGTTDLEGKRIPVALGWLLNITPAAVIPNELLYQVHGGRVSDIPSVYVRGAALTKGPDYPTKEELRAATVPPKSFITCLAEGLFRIEYANDQEKGAVTCDVKGAVIGGIFLETTAQIIAHILQDRGAVPAARILSASDAPWQFHRPVGFYAGPEDSSTCADVMSKLLRGCCGWGGFSRKGLFSLGSVRLATGPAVGIYEEPDIKAVVPVDLPDDLATPPWRWRVGYDRNWTVQSDDTLAGLVTEDRKKWLKEGQRLAEITNTTTKTFYTKPGDPDPIDGYFRDRDDAQRLAEELEILWRSPRGLYRVTLGTQAFARDLGDVIQITYSRWRLKFAPSATVVAISEDAEDDQSDMTVLVA